jgi:hypothetical protein
MDTKFAESYSLPFFKKTKLSGEKIINIEMLCILDGIILQN